MRRDSPLAEKEAITPEDLWDKPLILSHQRNEDLRLSRWFQCEPSQLHVVATYNLLYNASLLVDEGLGYAVTLDKLLNTQGSSLCFRPLKPRLESGLNIIWKKYQVFSPAAELFLNALKEELSV